MRLNDVDRAVWARISNELGDLCDELADDRIVADAGEEHWPEGSIGVEVWGLLNRAAMLALFASRLPEGGRETLAGLKELFTPPDLPLPEELTA